jgi:hypothetical protein
MYCITCTEFSPISIYSSTMLLGKYYIIYNQEEHTSTGNKEASTEGRLDKYDIYYIVVLLKVWNH